MLYFQVQKQIEDSEQVWKPRVDAASVPRQERPEAEEPQPEPRSPGQDEVTVSVPRRSEAPEPEQVRQRRLRQPAVTPHQEVAHTTQQGGLGVSLL